MQLNHNVHDAKPLDEFTALPAGWYPVVVAEEKECQNKSTQGAHLRLKYQVLDGHESARRVVFDRLNLNNRNATARQIAQQQLTSILMAIGRQAIATSAELVGTKMAVKLSVKQDQNRNVSNEVKAYAKIGEHFPQLAAGGGLAANRNPVHPGQPAQRPSPFSGADQPPQQNHQEDYSAGGNDEIPF